MASLTLLLLSYLPQVFASITVWDPSDSADVTADAVDNTLVADYTTDNGGAQYLIYNISGPYYYSEEDVELAHVTLTVDANDTSVLVGTEGSVVNLSYSDVIKYGYSTWLNQASFFGVNAAINIANQSTAYIDHANVTVHNGAANVYAYGTGTIVYVNDTDLYSSGPVSHGLYAGGNGTFVANNIRHFSGGERSSAFSGDSPAGYLHITDAVAHTAGIGSAIFYTLGETYGTNVIGHAENAPSLFSDGVQKSAFTNVDLTAGLLAGTILFSSSSRSSGASLSFTNSRLTTLGDDMPALWFGNVIAEAELVATTLNTTSGVLVLANTSQVTQAFDHFAGYEENSSIQPAEVTVTVSESTLTGDIVAYNSSLIAWRLTDYSSWTGAAVDGRGKGYLGVSLDATSNWTLTQSVYLQNFTDADTSLNNIISQGYSIYYNKSSSANSWLGSANASLPGGGSLIAY
ncbi:uncharacterized protein BO72DRAFT_212083 [Aspergillus fijiensis CBS 313.89]|uniref:Uncharacterized protein n=1 Tax=Aspergillus fijiensis CBS 313.89 TaxID=1448319 RepID=A0A8G1VWM5_9EURO|nr:uncharacterized protein BO72DRAFT_212083 [Aspergillus fijiensis CBS 313.89]RAK74356.1 hypothetical protein BO72DRAFT_212083 [Aspergillus fijiensis CBS 313.89]